MEILASSGQCAGKMPSGGRNVQCRNVDSLAEYQAEECQLAVVECQVEECLHFFPSAGMSTSVGGMSSGGMSTGGGGISSGAMSPSVGGMSSSASSGEWRLQYESCPLLIILRCSIKMISCRHV